MSHKLTPAQREKLVALRGCQPTTLDELSAALGKTDPSANGPVNKVLMGLVDRGLVVAGGVGRAAHYSLTTEGEEALGE